MINLLFVLPWLGIGGSEHVVLELARGLDKSRFKPIVFAINPGPLGPQFSREGLTTVISTKQPGQGHLRLIAQLNNTIRKYKIDIVLPHHMTSLYYSFVSARLLNRTRLYFTEHSVSGIESLSLPYKYIATILLFLSSGCIAISRAIFGCYIKSLRVPPSKIVYIPNGIDISRFEKPVDKAAKRRLLGIESGDLVIGTVANMKEVKNHRSLIAAFKKVCERNSDVTLALVGAGPLEKELQGIADRLGISHKVKFLGRRNDISELYPIFDIFCLPSFAEGFPLSILEAMASRVPVVATDVSGINEIIQSGTNGLLVPSDNSDRLASALLRLTKDRFYRQTLAIEGLNTVIEKYAFKNWIGKYELLFSTK